jgi:hypothetical protein
LLGPKIARRCSACSVESPCGLHRRFSNTSSIGMFSCAHARTPSASKPHRKVIRAHQEQNHPGFLGERTRWEKKRPGMSGKRRANDERARIEKASTEKVKREKT